MQQALNCRIESLEAELTHCRCRESELINERDRSNAAATAQCVKVTELETLVDQQTCRLDSLNAELQVSCLITVDNFLQYVPLYNICI